MATPLTALSKYTGVFMAILCALLMISFLIADTQQLGGGGPGGSSRAGEVVATWRGGSINERQLAAAVQHRNVLFAFQRAVYQLGTQSANEAGVGDLPLRVRPLELRTTMQQGVERDVVQKKIFAQRAEEAGMVVSDEMIVDYLRGLGRDRVSNEQMRGILSQMKAGTGRSATIAFMFDLLRDEMLANNYLMSHRYTFETILPSEKWQDWLKLNDRLSVEAAPVAAEDFIDQVEEPSDEELSEYFEQYRDKVASPEILRSWGGVRLPSPTPGFAIPERVTLTYLEANFDRAVDELALNVTDEEIKNFYNDNLDRFVEADRALFGDDTLFDDEPEEEDPAGETDDSGLGLSDSTDEPESAVGETPSPEVSGEEPATTPGEADGDESLAGEQVEEEEEEEEVPDTVEPVGEATEPSNTNVTYKPLEEVADDIRRQIASNRAAETLQGIMSQLKPGLDDAYAEYFNMVLDAEDAESDPPAPPEALANLRPLAEQYSLELVETEEMSQLELNESVVGKTINSDPSAPQALPTWFLAFRQRDLELYQPLVTYDLDGNRYLILVTERLEGEEPELEQVRDEVVAAWKQEKAAELALEKAKEIAASVNESGKTLRAYLAEPDANEAVGDVFETDTFSFLTIGTIAPTSREIPLRLSQPEPLVAPGPDLLEAVFELGPEETAAQWNHDHSIAYILRIAQRVLGEDELRQEFVRNGDRWIGAETLMINRVRRSMNALVLELLETADLTWDRDPDTPFEG